MKRFFASYDLRSEAEWVNYKFLEQAESLGWSRWIKGQTQMKHLPDTTLVGEFMSKTVAVAALKAARRETEVAVESPVKMPKWVVAEIGPATFNSDEVADDDDDVTA